MGYAAELLEEIKVQDIYLTLVSTVRIIGGIIMTIYNKNDDMSECTSKWGNTRFVLTREEVAALLDGKVLADPDFDEYGTFIKMEESKDD